MTTNFANTVRLGTVTLSNEIDEDSIYAFRNGGCAALAAKVADILIGLGVDAKVGISYIYEGYDEPFWELLHHAYVVIGDDALDIGGWCDLDGELACGWNGDDLEFEIVDPVMERWELSKCISVCPDQDQATVEYFAMKVIEEYIPEKLLSKR